MSGAGVAVAGGGRTPFGAIGGALAASAAPALAKAAASATLRGADAPAERLGAVVAAVGLPERGTDLGLAATLARELGVGSGTVSSTLIGVDAAAEALSVGHALAIAGRPTLIVGAESASRSAYWAPNSRVGAGEGAGTILDPLASTLDPLEGEGSPPFLLEREATQRGLDREALDRWAAGSHRRAAAAFRRAVQTVPVPELDRDELLRDEPEHWLAASPPLHVRGGSLTAANSAAPIDGAVALLLDAEADGPALSAPQRAAVEPGSASAAAAAGKQALAEAGISPGGLAQTAIGEASAAQALIAIDELGLDPESVNRRGGTLAGGRPSGGAVLAAAVELLAGPLSAPALLADEGPTGSGIAAVLNPG